MHSNAWNAGYKQGVKDRLAGVPQEYNYGDAHYKGQDAIDAQDGYDKGYTETKGPPVKPVVDSDVKTDTITTISKKTGIAEKDLGAVGDYDKGYKAGYADTYADFAAGRKKPLHASYSPKKSELWKLGYFDGSKRAMRDKGYYLNEDDEYMVLGVTGASGMTPEEKAAEQARLEKSSDTAFAEEATSSSGDEE
jgi:hypothetical protein